MQILVKDFQSNNLSDSDYGAQSRSKNTYIPSGDGKDLIDFCCPTFFTISKFSTRCKNKWQTTFLGKCPSEKSFACPRWSREKYTLRHKQIKEILKQANNSMLYFSRKETFTGLPEQIALAFHNTAWDYSYIS